MKLLVDTHALFWAVFSPAKLTNDARAAIGSDDNVVFVSLASLWELRIKEATGKIELPNNFYRTLPDKGFEFLPISLAHIETLGELPPYHRDPFDRMLVAQAIHEQITLVTRDEEISKYKVVILKA